MGKRKLKFDMRKNHERKRYNMKLVVSIPRNQVSVGQLIVSIPLPLYISLDVNKTSTLYSRLVATKLVPYGWNMIMSSGVLLLSKTHFLLSIASDSWSLYVDKVQLKSEKCQIFKKTPVNIKCVDAVVALVSLLERSVLCSGNADNKFSAICDAHKGHFRDKTGKPVLNNKQCLSLLYTQVKLLLFMIIDMYHIQLFVTLNVK